MGEFKNNSLLKLLILSIPLVMIFLLSACVTTGLETGQLQPYSLSGTEVQEHVLNNGLKVLMIEDHKSPVATFQIWYKVGSRRESAGKTGLSHYLEHAMFKGTPKYSSKEFSKIIQQNGGIDNAFTTKDYTMYYQTLISDRIGLSIDMESDRMTNLLLSPKEVSAEKNVIMEERRLRYEDDPQSLLFEKVTAEAITVHPYGTPVIGWMKDIQSIERDDLFNYYKTFYSPENAFIVVAGDIDPQTTIANIKQYFEKIPKVEVPQASIPQQPKQTAYKEFTLKKQAELPFILIAYQAPSIPDKDSYALEILTAIFSGKSGRLYQSLVKDKELALDSFAYYNGFYKDPYLYYFGATVKPGKDTQALKAALFAEIDAIKSSPPTERELQKAKNKITSDFIMGLDSTFFQGQVLGMFEIIGDWKMKDTYIEEINNVTVADVLLVADKYFSKDSSTVGILIPTY
ncbi:MAG: insulinase family protein [Candidatus Magnetoovum sp. WYHC-5]|nr:insulinase family protein [Candidatus Magnetoovum sp. WYHC-5]